jgi:Ca2+/H+ antiporter, TMEM165/GDT1 family
VIPILLTTYGVVFVSEIVGDKLLYTTGVLSARYRAAPVLFGMAAAFMLKMAAAVAVGKAISELPTLFVAGLTSASFIGVAVALWVKQPEPSEKKRDTAASTAAMVSFAAIFFSEWGDVGQITAAAMAARFGAPIIVWIGAVAAMVTKGALAVSVGAGVRRWIVANIPARAVRYAAISLLLLLGVLSVMETLTENNPKSEILKSLRAQLANTAVDYGKIVLVAHSMGGLVVQLFLLEEMRRESPNHLDRITEVVLYATPSNRLIKAALTTLVHTQAADMNWFGSVIQDLAISLEEVGGRPPRREQPRMVKELDLFESNHGCGLNGCPGSHPERRCNTTLHGSRIGA